MTSDEEKLRRTLAANIKKYRIQVGISQEKLAIATKLSDQTVREVETCRKWVSDKTIVKIARALHVEADQLLFPNNEAEKIFPVRLPADVLHNLLDNIKDDLERRFDAVVTVEDTAKI
jgi:transcriptional regulator with XRE-family HTH domain